MTLTLLRRLVVQALVVVVTLVAILTSGAPAQSLGDVARKEEVRRRSASAGKVYTNDSLRGAPTTPTTPAQPASTSPATGAAPADSSAGAKPAPNTDANPAAGADPRAGAGSDQKPTSDAKGDEATWRGRRKAIQDALDRAQSFAGALQSQINGLTTDFAARDDPAQRSRIATDRQRALTDLERAKKEVVQHTKALEDLQEEARKAGVPPGWLR